MVLVEVLNVIPSRYAGSGTIPMHDRSPYAGYALPSERRWKLVTYDSERRAYEEAGITAPQTWRRRPQLCVVRKITHSLTDFGTTLKKIEEATISRDDRPRQGTCSKGWG